MRSRLQSQRANSGRADEADCSSASTRSGMTSNCFILAAMQIRIHRMIPRTPRTCFRAGSPRLWIQQAVLLAALFTLGQHCAAAPTRPNILWLTCEDTGPQLGCYGDPYANTPNIDRLAGRSVRYKTVWSVAPVCAPARTAIITGLYPSSIGAEHMRSQVRLPAHMKLCPQLLREHGYYCSNNSKEDYNLAALGKVWDESSPRAHWKNRGINQPFFAIFNFTVSHESQIRTRPHTPIHDPAKARIPAYHPDTPEVRRDWAQFYDKVTEMDAQAGHRLQELQESGLADDTIIFFYGDHGSGMPRSKRWPFDSGLRVGLVVHIPEKFRELAPPDHAAGQVSDRLISFVDLAPTVLSLAGVQPPPWMQGTAFLGNHRKESPKYLHGQRGRMDERLDLVRSTRNERYVYIRNYMPHLPYGQRIDYMFQTPTTRIWKQLYDEGKLNPPQTYFWERKPIEELYDTWNDRDEVLNLAESSSHEGILRELREAQRRHLLQIKDIGLIPEAEMHSRAENLSMTPQEIGNQLGAEALESILNAAELAASRDLSKTALRGLIKALDSKDSAVRYWGLTGVQVRGRRAFESRSGKVQELTRDESPSVRIVAAELMATWGQPSEQDRALEVLKNILPTDGRNSYLTIQALNAIERLGSKAGVLKPTLMSLPRKHSSTPPRIAEYVPRLLDDWLSR